ncbi:MAG: N,N-dimethylformamidase beta subunit family domain-containing protein [Pseudomonadota bacterium]
MRASTPHINVGRGLPRTLLVALLVTATVAVAAQLASLVTHPPAGDPATVHAERTGITLGSTGLAGRVDLVSSVPGVRWRIAGVTPWREATGRVLVRGWDTTARYDGPYALQLVDRGRIVTQTLVVRNVTPVATPEEEIANASAGLKLASTDAQSVVAAFGRRSYRPGDLATIRLARSYPSLHVDILRCGPEQELTVGNETMRGVRMTSIEVARGRSVRVRVGDWPSGVYVARLASTRGRVGFAPFVLRPLRLGEHRVAVVQPTNTWQAYNYRDGDGDGRPDSWYGNARSRVVDVGRPYLSRGVPPHFRQYDLGFIRWLAHTGKQVDMLAQEDVEQVSGDRLASLYDLIVFPGHHEYATEREYDAIVRYRNLGGNLAFLSANNFFWRVDRRGSLMYRIAMWRDLGRPESALVGVQYFDWNHGTYDSRRFAVRGAQYAPWLFAGTGVGNGGALGWFGIEVDGRTAASPRSTRVLAVMANAFGSGRTAEMTYYETPRGARVYAAGAFTLAGRQARMHPISRVLQNLWDHLAVAA